MGTNGDTTKLMHKDTYIRTGITTRIPAITVVIFLRSLYIKNENIVNINKKNRTRGVSDASKKKDKEKIPPNENIVSILLHSLAYRVLMFLLFFTISTLSHM